MKRKQQRLNIYYIIKLECWLKMRYNVLYKRRYCSRVPGERPTQKKNNPYTVPLLLTGVTVYQVTYYRKLNNTTDYPCECLSSYLIQRTQ